MSCRYEDSQPGKPLVAVLAICGSAFFSYLVLTGEYPVFIHFVLGLFGLVLFLIALGATISTTVEVDEGRNLVISRSMAGILFARTHLDSQQIIRIELNRAMSAGSPKSSDMGSNLSTPRYRVEIVHAKGKHLASASRGDLRNLARRLAEALDCPMETTGQWYG